MSNESLERRVEIETPEQTILSYTVAGVGSRTAAALVDLVIIIVGQLSIFLVIAEISSVFDSRTSAAQKLSGGWVTAIGLLFSFALIWGYYVMFEGIWDGQTPGKRMLGIRVVQDGGYSVSFGASAVRNLLRFVDMQPGILYAIGLVSVTISKSGKRLGDIVAGTFVVHERRALIKSAARATSDVGTRAAITSRLTEEEFALLGRFIARRTELDPALRNSFASQIATRYREHLVDNGGAPMAQLLRLFETESDARARGLPSPGAKGAARERHAIVALNAGRWRDFSTALAAAQQRGLRAMSPEEVSHLVSLYREVSTDLARLRTASESEDQDAIFYVSRLLGAGHNFLYRQRGLSARDVWRYVSISVPREVRRSASFILASAFFLFVPMAITFGALVRHPELAPRLLPLGMIDRVTEGAHRDSTGKHEYISTRDFERPVMASAIIRNNVQITFGVFAAGITGDARVQWGEHRRRLRTLCEPWRVQSDSRLRHRAQRARVERDLHCGRRRLSARVGDAPPRRAHAPRGLRDQRTSRDSPDIGVDDHAPRRRDDRGAHLPPHRHSIRREGGCRGGHGGTSRVLVLAWARRRRGFAGRGVRLHRAARLELEVVIHHSAREPLRRHVEHRHTRAAHANDRLVARTE
jgi:uncharacterized RDD family membrane protein YckC